MPTTYLALLRGVNVGGKRVVKMTDLVAMFTAFGCADVQTYIQSGNVIFKSKEPHPPRVRRPLQAHLAKALGYPIDIILRTAHEMQTIVTADPFAKLTVTDNTRLNITFLADKTKVKPILTSPVTTAKIMLVTDREIYWMFEKVGDGLPSMKDNFSEKALGTPVTTRNWAVTQALCELMHG